MQRTEIEREMKQRSLVNQANPTQVDFVTKISLKTPTVPKQNPAVLAF